VNNDRYVNWAREREKGFEKQGSMLSDPNSRVSLISGKEVRLKEGMYAFLKDRIDGPILSIGAGPCDFEVFLAGKDYLVVAYDMMQELLEVGKKEMKKVDLRRLRKGKDILDYFDKRYHGFTELELRGFLKLVGAPIGKTSKSLISAGREAVSHFDDADAKTKYVLSKVDYYLECYDFQRFINTQTDNEYGKKIFEREDPRLKRRLLSLIKKFCEDKKNTSGATPNRKKRYDAFAEKLKREKSLTRKDLRMYFVQGDAENIRFGDERMGSVFMNDMLGNVSNKEKAVKECARVLEKGKKLVITVSWTSCEYYPPQLLAKPTMEAGLSLVDFEALFVTKKHNLKMLVYEKREVPESERTRHILDHSFMNNIPACLYMHSILKRYTTNGMVKESDTLEKLGTRYRNDDNKYAYNTQEEADLSSDAPINEKFIAIRDKIIKKEFKFVRLRVIKHVEEFFEHCGNEAKQISIKEFKEYLDDTISKASPFYSVLGKYTL